MSVLARSATRGGATARNRWAHARAAGSPRQTAPAPRWCQTRMRSPGRREQCAALSYSAHLSCALSRARPCSGQPMDMFVAPRIQAVHKLLHALVGMLRAEREFGILRRRQRLPLRAGAQFLTLRRCSALRDTARVVVSPYTYVLPTTNLRPTFVCRVRGARVMFCVTCG